jgi:peptide/nickel transport system permease protein
MALQPPKLWPPIYWFGTDNVGEPVLVDIANEAPFIIEISFLAGLYTTLIGLVVGLISGVLWWYS